MNTDPASSDPEEFEEKLDFWMKSAAFAVTSMEIWEQAGKQDRFDEAVQQMRKVLETLQKLIEQLGEEPGEENT